MFLSEAKLGKEVIARFAKEGINGATLLTLTDDDLKGEELALTLGERKLFRLHLEQVLAKASGFALHPDSPSFVPNYGSNIPYYPSAPLPLGAIHLPWDSLFLGVIPLCCV